MHRDTWKHQVSVKLSTISICAPFLLYNRSSCTVSLCVEKQHSSVIGLSSEFQCGNNICVPLENVCDGVDDCGNWDDERLYCGNVHYWK